jgi:hypothetical protein
MDARNLTVTVEKYSEGSQDVEKILVKILCMGAQIHHYQRFLPKFFSLSDSDKHLRNVK